MKKYINWIGSLMLVGTVSCTSLSTGSTELVTGPENRVQLVVEDPETLREGMDEQASEINRKRNIEEFDRNEPAMTPPTLRPTLVPHAPVDSAVHNNTDWLMPHVFRNRLLLR